VVMFQVEVFWVVTPCNVAVGYRRFRGPNCCNGYVSSNGRMILNNVLLMILQEGVVSYFRYYSGTYMDGLRKIQYTFSQKS
jgi:hypothetical protein